MLIWDVHFGLAHSGFQPFNLYSYNKNTYQILLAYRTNHLVCLGGSLLSDSIIFVAVPITDKFIKGISYWRNRIHKHSKVKMITISYRCVSFLQSNCPLATNFYKIKVATLKKW